MPIALTRLARRVSCVPKTPFLAILAVLPCGEVLALVTDTDSPGTTAVLMAATIFTTVAPSPAQIADADVVWRARAISMLALNAACLVAILSTVTLKASVTLTIIGAWQIDTGSVDMALVNAEATLVDVWTGEILPLLTLALAP